MLLDTSSAEAALDALLAFSYQPPDTTPVFLSDHLPKRHSRTYELNSAIRKLEQTVAAVSKLEQKVALLQTRLRDHVAAARNALGVTAALPTELLCEIFRMVGDSDGSSKARIVLSHVSRRWRAIAIAIPELWTVIETGPGLRWTVDMMREFSRRAGSLELHVSNSRTYRELPADLDRDFAARCTKISLLEDASYSALRALVPSGYYGDTIRELVVEAPQHELTNAPVFQLGEELHGCRILHMRGVRFPVDGVVLHLDVLHVANMMVQDFDEVICAMHCDTLEELYVSNIVVDDQEDDGFIQETSESIVLRLGGLKLRHLEIKECRPKILNMFFHNWSKPLPRSLHIHIETLIKSPYDDDTQVFTFALLDMLTDHAQNVEAFTLSGPVEWILHLAALVRLVQGISILPSLLHLTLRANTWVGAPIPPPPSSKYSTWGLDLLAERSRPSSAFPRLDTLTMSEWTVKGYEGRIREHVGELILLPDERPSML